MYGGLMVMVHRICISCWQSGMIIVRRIAMKFRTFPARSRHRERFGLDFEPLNW